MMKPILEIKNISKKFKINHEKQSYLSLRDSLVNLFKRSQKTEEEFWALKDVSFNIEPGQSVGIVGKNGAGKSTLLKILSKITPPSSGSIISRGRIASLLEVGTGFHPELTGRENIFLNGSILGLKRKEINAQFDAIVDFSGVSKFLDTPLKHYSSGMQLRLAFAVAAHLEPEILIIDEVLAVGDADFQKKCMGKMGEVSKSGRTILFVSHNMAAIQSLTTESIFLSQGQVFAKGKTDEIIHLYSNFVSERGKGGEDTIKTQGEITKIRNIRLLNSSGDEVSVYSPGEKFYLEVDFYTKGHESSSLEFFLLDNKRVKIGLASTYQFHEIKLPKNEGRYKALFTIDGIQLASGIYTIDVATSIINSHWDHYVEDALKFEILYCNPLKLSWDFKQEYSYGNIAMLLSEKPVFKLY